MFLPWLTFYTILFIVVFCNICYILQNGSCSYILTFTNLPEVYIESLEPAVVARVILYIAVPFEVFLACW